jgi:hypothetical protein
MKTLKKSLALVLAVVMVVGVLAISASAATYNDDAQIQYKEAVEVLSLVGVIDGKDGDNFDPTGTLTRQEAAKIVTYIINQKGAEALSKTSSFADVTASSKWAAGYISYCASQGIIAGIGNNKFDPTGTLTGTAWAKILLCALGYDADAEGFTNANWAVNVTAKSEELELADGIDGFDYDAAITREEACQMAFNALGEYIVTYTDKGQNITVSGSDVNVSITTGASQAQKSTNKLQSKLPKTLEEPTEGTDAFGRPTLTYSYNGEEATVTATPVATYTATVTANTLRTALGLKTSDTATATVIVDGKTSDETATISKSTAKADQFTVANGQTAELYDVDGTYTIVVTNTNVGIIASVTAAKGETKRYVTLDSGETFTTENFAEKDVVLYTAAEVDGKTQVKSMTAAEKVSEVEVTKITGSITSFVASGTTYSTSKNLEGAGNIDINAKIDLYLDAQGNVIYASTVAGATTPSVIILGIAKQSSNELFSSSSDTWYAKVLNADGTVEVVELDGTSYTESSTPKIAKLTEKDNGKYTITYDASNASKTEATITKGAVDFNSVNVNSKTVFVVETVDKSGNSTYAAYTGYKTVPSVKGTATYATANGYATLVYVAAAEAVEADQETSNVLIALASESAMTTDANGSYYTYNAVVDGKITTIDVSTDVTKVPALASKITTNSKGIVTAIVDAGKTAGEGIDFANDILTVASKNYSVADDCVIYTVSATGEIASIATTGIAKSDKNTAIVVTDTKTGNVTELYIFIAE